MAAHPNGGPPRFPLGSLPAAGLPPAPGLMPGAPPPGEALLGMPGGSGGTGGGTGGDEEVREQDRYLPVANIARIMKRVLPANEKIAKDAKESVQECVSEFISFITSEASDRCQQEKRKTINGDDLLWAMSTLGFDDYCPPLKVYLQKYRQAAKGDKPDARREDAFEPAPWLDSRAASAASSVPPLPPPASAMTTAAAVAAAAAAAGGGDNLARTSLSAATTVPDPSSMHQAGRLVPGAPRPILHPVVAAPRPQSFEVAPGQIPVPVTGQLPAQAQAYQRLASGSVTPAQPGAVLPSPGIVSSQGVTPVVHHAPLPRGSVPTATAASQSGQPPHPGVPPPASIPYQFQQAMQRQLQQQLQQQQQHAAAAGTPGAQPRPPLPRGIPGVTVRPQLATTAGAATPGLPYQPTPQQQAQLQQQLLAQQLQRQRQAQAAVQQPRPGLVPSTGVTAVSAAAASAVTGVGAPTTLLPGQARPQLQATPLTAAQAQQFQQQRAQQLQAQLQQQQRTQQLQAQGILAATTAALPALPTPSVAAAALPTTAHLMNLSSTTPGLAVATALPTTAPSHIAGLVPPAGVTMPSAAAIAQQGSTASAAPAPQQPSTQPSSATS